MSTPLAHAAMHGDLTAIGAIIAQRPFVDLNSITACRSTALILAIKHKQDAACNVLLSTGDRVDVNACYSNDGWTPLHHAAANGMIDIVRRLIAAGAMKSSQNRDRQKAIDLAICPNMKEILRADSADRDYLDMSPAEQDDIDRMVYTFTYGSIQDVLDMGQRNRRRHNSDDFW